MKELLYDFYGYNVSIFYSINNFCANNKLLVPFSYISKIFDIENFAIYYVLAAIIGYLKLRAKPKILSLYYDFMAKLGISYTSFGLIYAALKFTINMPRPFCSLLASSFTTIVSIEHERCLSSFPSSHTGLAVLIALNIWPFITNMQKIFTIFIIIMVAISRICLAMHYPADVIYSIFIAFIVFFIARLIYSFFQNNIIEWVKRRVVIRDTM